VALRAVLAEGATRGWLAAIVASSEYVVGAVALDGMVTSWNAAAQPMYGYRHGRARRYRAGASYRARDHHRTGRHRDGGNCGGHGSLFRISLPTAGSAPGAAVHGHGEVILVVDDEPALREATSRVLTNHGYITVEASVRRGPAAHGDFVQKPFTSRALLGKVAAVLAHSGSG
jgi:PAS domain-containing protein